MENSIIREDISFLRLDQDTDFTNYQVGSYFDCLNMKIISDDSLSSVALTNIKGNKSFISVPDTYQITRVSLDYSLFVPFYATTVDLDINGVTYTLTINSNIISIAQYYQLIVDQINLLNSNGTLLYIVAYVQSDNLAIYITTTTDVNFIITNFITPFVATLDVITQQTNLKIIGWCNLREDIYLFTTNNSAINPGSVDPDLPIDLTSSYGQIWKFTYDKITKTATPLSLKYNNVLNFTQQHPIANPGGVETRYENRLIQKLYWTDYFNVPRSFNVADPNGFGLLPLKLNITTTINHTIPTLYLVNQSGGSLTTAIHQIAYRLKNSGGGESTFSVPSNLVHITTQSENLPYAGTFYSENLYQGSDSGTISSKSLIFEIKDLDVSFDRIEIVSLVTEAINQSPEINIIADLPLPNNGYMTFTYTGNEPKIPITLNEFNALQLNFRTVKTISEKNNKLFPANVKKADFDIIYDARAYRFKGDPVTNLGETTTDLYDSLNTIITVESTNWTINGVDPVPENHDCIQSYVNQDYKDYTNNLYQPGTNIYGGKGPNVTYTFTPCNKENPDKMILDQKITMDDPQKAPYRNSSGYSTIFDLDDKTNQVFPLFDGYQDHHHPVVSGTLKGYMRDEMYRFGVVFYDVMGNPGYVKWIADIRMPHLYMPDLTNSSSSFKNLEYPTSGTEAGSLETELYGYNLGIDFTFNFTSLTREDKAKIRGFSVVRCKREEFDKHILAQGTMHPILKDAALEAHIIGSITAMESTGLVDYINEGVTFDAPDFYFNSDPNHSDGDTLDIIAILEDSSTSGIKAGEGSDMSVNAAWKVVKNYILPNSPPASILRDVNNTEGYTPDSNNPYPITSILPIKPWLSYGSTYESFTGVTLWNVSRTVGGIEASMGNRTLYIENDASLFSNFSNLAGGEDYANTGGVFPTPDDDMYTTNRRYLANYKRDVLKQYGGNSFSERSTSEYILCSDYFQIPESYDLDNLSFPITPYQCRIYGGDTFVCVYDHIKQLANINETNLSDTALVGNLIVMETSTNLELRQADKISSEDGATTNPLRYRYVFNKCATPNQDRIGMVIEEEFTYNQVYSSDNETKTFFPKPDPFIFNDEFDNRIYNSEEKANGELADSWGIFKEGNYLDVDGGLGPINNLITLNNALLFFQDKGVGKASVNERTAVATSSGDLTVGTGGTLDRFDYITRESGSKHQFGFTKNDNTVWYFDVIQKTIFQLNQEGNNPISDLKGLHSYFQRNLIGSILVEDNPYIGSGVTATYDFKNKDVIFTFIDKRDTLIDTTPFSCTVSYNILTKSFISFHSYTPGFYINDKYHMFTSNNNNEIFIHEEDEYSTFYGTIYPCKLTVLSNKYPKQTKILTNLEWLTESYGLTTYPFPYVNNDYADILEDTWNTIRVRNSKQNTDFQDVQLIGKRRERTWNIKVPKDRVLNLQPNTNIYGVDLSPTRILYGKTMRDKYQYIDFQYDNTNNYRFIMHYLTNLLRVSPR